MVSSKNTMGKYCSALKFIEKANPTLGEVISDLCLEKRLVSKRNSDGITFLMPNEVLTKKIVDIAYGNDPEAAQDMISACIILGAADSAQKFSKSTSNKLGYQLNLTKVDGNNAIINNTLKITPDPKFKSMKGSNFSIWKIVDGEPIMSGSKVDKKEKKEKKNGKRGGSATQEIQDQTLLQRRQIFDSIKNSYANQLYNRLSTIGGTSTNNSNNDTTTQRNITSLVNRIYTHALEENNINSPFNKAFTAIASVWDQDPMVNASILLNPDPQIAAILHNAYNQLEVTGGLSANYTIDPSQEYNNYSDASKAEELLKALGNDAKYIEANQLLNQKRKEIGKRYMKKGAIYNSQEIMDAYKDLYINNQVSHGGKTVTDVFPSSFIESLKEAQPNTVEGQNNIVKNALARDLLRHTLNASYRDLESDATPTSLESVQSEVDTIFNDAKLYYGSADANANASLFNNLKNINGMADRSSFDVLRLSFLNSSDFLYLPVSGTTGGSTEIQEHNFGTYYNRSNDARSRLNETSLSLDMSSISKIHS